MVIPKRPVPVEDISGAIRIVRGHKGILDDKLAAPYGVSNVSKQPSIDTRIFRST
jgi:hypothetical protein